MISYLHNFVNNKVIIFTFYVFLFSAVK